MATRRKLPPGPAPRSDARAAPTNVERYRAAIAAGWSPPVARLVGFRLTEIDRGRATIELRAGSQHANPMGTLHGGVLCDIADAAMGMAFASTLPPDRSFTTIELKISFLRPVWTGRLVAQSRVLRRGRLVGLVACRIVDDRRRLVAYATSTCMALPREAGRGLVRSRQK